MTGHFVYVLKGWISFRYAGIAETVTVSADAPVVEPAKIDLGRVIDSREVGEGDLFFGLRGNSGPQVRLPLPTRGP